MFHIGRQLVIPAAELTGPFLSAVFQPNHTLTLSFFAIRLVFQCLVLFAQSTFLLVSIEPEDIPAAHKQDV